MLSDIKAYQSEIAGQRPPSKNYPSCCTRVVCLQRIIFDFDQQLPCLYTFRQNALSLMTGWFGGPSKFTKWIKKKSFTGLVSFDSPPRGGKKLLLTGWFGGSSKFTKQIKEKAVSLVWLVLSSHPRVKRNCYLKNDSLLKSVST